MMWRIAAEDGMGRTVGSTIVAVAVHQSLRCDDEEVMKRIEQAAEEWRARVTAAHRAFNSTRLDRELGMVAGQALTHVFQPGLFDRRNERARLAIAASHGAAVRDRADRIVALERARPVTLLRPQLLLVLKPRS